MGEKCMLHVSDKDIIPPGTPPGLALEELLKRAVMQKCTVDGVFRKIASGTDAASGRM